MDDTFKATTPPAIDLANPPRHLTERLAGFTARLRRHIPELTAAEAIHVLVELGLDAAERPDLDPDALLERWKALRQPSLDPERPAT